MIGLRLSSNSAVAGEMDSTGGILHRDAPVFSQRERRWPKKVRRRFLRAFIAWVTDERNPLFGRIVYEYRTDAVLYAGLTGLKANISLVIDAGQQAVVVWVMHNSQVWDWVSDFNAPAVRVGPDRYICRDCLEYPVNPESRREMETFPDREALWRMHAFEAFSSWARLELCRQRTVELYGMFGESTWAYWVTHPGERSE